MCWRILRRSTLALMLRARKWRKSGFPRFVAALRRARGWLAARAPLPQAWRRNGVPPIAFMHGFAGLCALVAAAGASSSLGMRSPYGEAGPAEVVTQAALGNDVGPQFFQGRESDEETRAAPAQPGHRALKPGQPQAKAAPGAGAAESPAQKRRPRAANAARPGATAKQRVAHAARPGTRTEQRAANAARPGTRTEQRAAHAARPGTRAERHAASAAHPGTRAEQHAAHAAHPAARDEDERAGSSLSACGETGLGPGRAIPVDATGGPRFGLIQFKNTLPLKPNEVIFTFDDGPHPRRTLEILDTLDRYCVKAVFFVIGDLALRYPDVIREIDRRGHVVATHTWSHPVSLSILPLDRAQEQIEQGFAAVADALGKPPAPFFRFPGLGHSTKLLEFVAANDIAIWSVDAIAGDSEGVSAARMPGRLMSRLKKYGRGILLFHDIKKTTVDALPAIMEQLHEEGYRAAYAVPRGPVLTVPTLTATLDPPARTGRRDADRRGKGKSR